MFMLQFIIPLLRPNNHILSVCLFKSIVNFKTINNACSFKVDLNIVNHTLSTNSLRTKGSSAIHFHWKKQQKVDKKVGTGTYIVVNIFGKVLNFAFEIRGFALCFTNLELKKDFLNIMVGVVLLSYFLFYVSFKNYFATHIKYLLKKLKKILKCITSIFKLFSSL